MATCKKPADPKLRILALDPELSPYRSDLKLRMRLYGEAKKKLTTNGSLSDFANGSLYYGLHKGRNGWYYREWAPAAEKMSLIGDFNGWDPSKNPMKKLKNGNWEAFVRGTKTIPHGSHIKVRVTHNGESFDRIPLYIHRIHQFPDGSCTGQVWEPETPFVWSDGDFALPAEQPLFIYEAHIGMATEKPRIGTYREFAETVLPRIREEGYNALQKMAIM